MKTDTSRLNVIKKRLEIAPKGLSYPEYIDWAIHMINNKPDICIANFPYPPKYCNNAMKYDIQSIQEHMIAQHKLPTNTVKSLSDVDLYQIHDELHFAEEDEEFKEEYHLYA